MREREPQRPVPKLEPPDRRIIYDRRGNLSTITKLDEEKTDGFMRAGDMRRDIFIVDSDRGPELSAVSVGSDILAFRGIEPIRKLTEVRFRSKPFHTLIRQDHQFEIQVHERLIDDKVRRGHYIDTSDYNEQFLELLNKAVKAGLGEALFQEKLGLHDQLWNYCFYGYSFSIWSALNLATREPLDKQFILLYLLLAFTFGHPMLQSLRGLRIDPPDREVPPHIRKNWYEVLLPLIPVDKWVLGRIFLARHGEKMIIPR